MTEVFKMFTDTRIQNTEAVINAYVNVVETIINFIPEAEKSATFIMD